jgi:dipeptidyl aminopeptidase/acylaminoacyl peptidase
LLVAFIVTISWISYQQTIDYLHPPRRIASGALLRENGVDFQEVELTTEDHVKLSAWYTPPKNGAVILVAHGYGGARTEHYHALFASDGYGVITWDFRAHGKAGDPSWLGCYEVLDAKPPWLHTAPLGVEHISAWGGLIHQ